MRVLITFLFLALVVSMPRLSAQSTFPSVSIATLDGNNRELADYVGNGKATVVAIWATWCRPCQTELDHFKDYNQRWTQELDAEVLAISVDQRHHVRRIQPMLRQKGWPYQVVVDSDRALQQLLGFSTIPQLYVLDGDGQIVAQYSGYDAERAQQVDDHLERLASRKR